MKIAFTADLHADLETRVAPDELARLRDRIAREAPDVFIHAGDLVGVRKDRIAPALGLFDGIEARKLAVAGNHDLWLEGSDSFAFYNDDLPAQYAAAGFHLLDAGPVRVGNVAFVGNVGWYDYSFMDPGLPPTRHRSYERKMWYPLARWNDGVFVKLGMGDAEFNDILLDRLARHLGALPAEVRTVVAVTHHVAFEEMVPRRQGHPTWNFCNAFLGSRALGEQLLADSRVAYHLCGHTHQPARLQKGQLTAINVGSTYRKKRLEVVAL